MQSIFDYVSHQIFEAFNKPAANINLFKKYLHTNIGDDQIEAEAIDVANILFGRGINDAFTFDMNISNKHREVKIKRCYEKVVRDIIADLKPISPNYEWRPNNTSISLYNVSGKSRSRGRLSYVFRFTFGDGSNKDKVDPLSHELISTAVLNIFFNSHDKIDVEDLRRDDIRENIISRCVEMDRGVDVENLEVSLDNTGWLMAWVAQFNTIKQTLKDWKNVRVERFASNGEIAQFIERFYRTSLMKIAGITKKDNLDPSDVFLYDETKISEIISRLEDAIGVDDDEEKFSRAKAEYISLFQDHMFTGLSLKKGSNFKATLVNYGDNYFEDARVESIDFDPIRSIFKIESEWLEFKKDPKSFDLDKYRARLDQKDKDKSTKSCSINISFKDIDENNKVFRREANILFRTNQKGPREAITCEPHIKNSKAQVGKVPVRLWRNMIINKVPSYSEIAGLMALKGSSNTDFKYNMDIIRDLWEGIKSKAGNRLNTKVSTDDIIYIFTNFIPNENNMNGELWSIYNQLYMIYTVLSDTGDENAVRDLMMWAEKVGDNCMPYLLIGPKK